MGETVGLLRGSTGVDVWGTLAEKVVVPTADLAPVPQGWSLEEMAGAPLVFLTAWQALTQWSDPAPPPRRFGAAGDRCFRGRRHGLGSSRETMNLTVWPYLECRERRQVEGTRG